MDAARWARIEALLDRLLECAPGEVEGILESECGGDPGLRADVERYLQACRAAETGGALPALASVGEGPGIPPHPMPSTGDPRRSGDPGGEGRGSGHLNPGDEVGAYRIVDALGQGGMGVVYLAERADGAFQRKVAVKVVKRGMDSDEILRRFHREREILARLQHPNIARLLDGGLTPDGLPFFVMELVEGEPIDRWCDLKGLGVEERLRLFLTVCDAVRYAHGALVVHRDLKPGNILVSGGEARLLDFGIAKVLQDDDGDGLATRPFAQRLTPDYAAPEQIRGEPTTTAVDVYALGVLLFELLVGELPFRLSRPLTRRSLQDLDRSPPQPSTVALHDDPENPGDAVRRALCRGTTPSVLRQRLRGDLDAILQQALAPEIDRRYSSVEALIRDLQRHLAGLPVRARPASRWYRTSRFVRRNRGLVAAGTVAAMALLGGSVATSVFAVLANEERDRRQLEAERATAARDFVVGLFAELDPDLGEGRSTFTRDDLIELGARGLEEVDGQPELRAGILNTLGQVAFNLGERERARSFFEESMGLLQGMEAEPELATSMMGIGEVLRAELRFDEAEGWFTRALELRRAQFPGQDPRVTETRAALAFSLYNQGAERFAEAEALFLELLQPEGGEPMPPRVRASILGGLASVHLGQGRHADAVAGYEEALAVREALETGTTDPTSARLLWGLGHAHRLQGELARSEEAYRQALEHHRTAYGERHANVAWGHYNLAGVLEEQTRYPDAADHFREAARIMDAVQQPGYLYTAFAWQGVGRSEEQAGRLGAAEEAYRVTIERYHGLGWEEDPGLAGRLAAVHLALGRVLEASRQLDDAAAEYQVSLDLYRDAARSAEGVERAERSIEALRARRGRP